MTRTKNVITLATALAAMHGAFGGEPRMASDRELDEVLVQGGHQDLASLRKDIIEAEDRFNERYNDLNPVDDFDVGCRLEVPTGTQLRKRHCRAVYEDSALREEGREAFHIRQFLQDPNNIKLMPASPPVPAATAIQARRAEFESNMQTVVLSNDDLILLLKDHAAAVERYQNAKRRSGNERDWNESVDTESTALDE